MFFFGLFLTVGTDTDLVKTIQASTKQDRYVCTVRRQLLTNIAVHKTNGKDGQKCSNKDKKEISENQGKIINRKGKQNQGKKNQSQENWTPRDLPADVGCR
jgi:hypothetical protein